MRITAESIKLDEKQTVSAKEQGIIREENWEKNEGAAEGVSVIARIMNDAMHDPQTYLKNSEVPEGGE
jgi:hypothetical protein